jgi:hypothetical protein
VFLPDHGLGSFVTIKIKENNGTCGCSFLEGNQNFLIKYHCYQFQNAQDYIADKIQMLEEERERYSKLSEEFSILQKNRNYPATGL